MIRRREQAQNKDKKRKSNASERKALKRIVHQTEVRVIYADTDAMSVVYHSNYLKWFEVGRTELLRSIGYPYVRLEKEGFMLPVTECGCKYIHPARYDDVLEITTVISEVKAATIILEYEIRRKGERQLLVTGFTKHAVIDKCFKPVRLQKVAPDLYGLVIGAVDRFIVPAND